MTPDSSFFSYFIHASFIVKCVMFILLGASIFSWMVIFQRATYLKAVRNKTENFEAEFFAGEELSKIYAEGLRHKAELQGAETIFHAGYKEFLRMHKHAGASIEATIENVKRAMRVAQMRAQDSLESSLSFLAIVGSNSVYVGLFGTVWGIMQSLSALANVQQATIAMVAPGIAETLIATALGLFTAIPALIAYNRYITDINQLINRFDAFQEEFINLLCRIENTHANENGNLQAVGAE